MRPKLLMNFLIVAVVIVSAFAIWVRIAPTDTASWHVDPSIKQDKSARSFQTNAEFKGIAEGVGLLETDPALPDERSSVIAGSPEDGFVTYMLRTRTFGYPDFLSAKWVPNYKGGVLYIYSRSRFGYSDLGRNKRRVLEWIKRLETHVK